MSNKIFMSVAEVADELGVSESYAYKLVQRMNKELKAAGYYTIQGKIDRKYFHEKFYDLYGKQGNSRLALRKEGTIILD